MKATHIPYLLILASASLPGIARQTPQPQQVQSQPAPIQAPASACAETDPDAQIVCLNKEHAYLLKLQQIKKMQQDNDALANAPARPELAAKPEPPQDKPATKRKDCLMPGDKQKMLPEILHGFYDAQRAKIIKDSKGQLTPPTWAEMHVPLPPCPADTAIPVTAK